MGSPLAPVLCALVAAEQEFLTIRTLQMQVCYAASGTRTTDAFSCAAPNFRQIGQDYFSDLKTMGYSSNFELHFEHVQGEEFHHFGATRDHHNATARQ